MVKQEKVILTIFLKLIFTYLTMKMKIKIYRPIISCDLQQNINIFKHFQNAPYIILPAANLKL